MINTLQELLEDYARFSCMEDRIDPETSEELQKGAKDYLKQLNELDLLTLTDVGCSLPTKEDDTEYWIDLVNWESGGIEEVSNKNLLNFKNDINLEIQKRLKQ